MTADATYLGDGLYVTHDRWQVELYAHNGIDKTDRVFLDPPTLRAFLGYLEREGLRDELRNENNELRCVYRNWKRS